jgi:hypothetical protein
MRIEHSLHMLHRRRILRLDSTAQGGSLLG